MSRDPTPMPNQDEVQVPLDGLVTITLSYAFHEENQDSRPASLLGKTVCALGAEWEVMGTSKAFLGDRTITVELTLERKRD